MCRAVCDSRSRFCFAERSRDFRFPGARPRYEGNSQELDHIYVSSALVPGAQFQPLHVNSEFTNQVSDHDPTIASFNVVANQAPVAQLGADQTVLAGSTVTLDGSASFDPDGQIVGYAWSQSDGPTVTLQNDGTATPSFVAPNQNAFYTFALTVMDNDGATSVLKTHVTVVVPNQAPVANAGADQKVKYNAIVTLDGRASHDADGSIVAYAWVQTGGPAVALTGANTATPSFRAPHTDAQLTFTLTVTDNEGAQGSDSVTTNVTTKK